MSDSEEKRRPNANYRLSKENADSEEITYHYNRERRLEKAPQSVRNLYKEETPRRFNPLRPLIDTRPKRMMFASIILICITVMVLSILGYAGGSRVLDGNLLSVQAVKFEGAIIATVTKSISKNFFGRPVPAYSGAVYIAVTAGETPPEDVFYHRIFFTLEPQEQYRFSLPFDSDELTFVFQTEKNTLNMKIKTE